MSSDPINPKHYKHLPAEAIDIIEAAIAKAPSNKLACLHWQTLKYLLRCWEKKGIEDLRKAKWYLDRMVNEFDDLLAEINAPILNGAIEQPKPSKTQPPSGYRLLGDAKVEPRYVGDIHWCAVANGWCSVTEELAPFANRDNWAACRKIQTPDDEPSQPAERPKDFIENFFGGVAEILGQSPTKRYREPTLADLANGPIQCEVRDWDSEQWKARQLIQIHESGPFRFLCKRETCDNPLNWNQCRIEATE